MQPAPMEGKTDSQHHNFSIFGGDPQVPHLLMKRHSSDLINEQVSQQLIPRDLSLD